MLLDSINSKDGNGWTPLHYAAHEGHLFTCDLLLSRDVDPTVTDGSAFTPLHVS